ncbi:hypothetical protein CRYUN_Cryun24cG0082700 [Craigia yunnanensis]
MVVKLSFDGTIGLTEVRYELSFREFSLYPPIKRKKLMNLEVRLTPSGCGELYLEGSYLDGNYNSGWILVLL